ncbi:MAG TPA: hypothetical protein VEU72_09060 [Nitrosopumilaceae archaeon]|nr:hypothetical protein [Nitrosopumilaceae archaeon]
MSILESDEKITCSTCGKIIPVRKEEEHIFECVGKKNGNRN